MGDYLQVQFNNKKNCFCQVTSKLLHGKLRQHIDDLVCVKLTTSSSSCYVTASQVTSGSQSKLDISGLYANKLNLSEGSKVLVEIVENPVKGLRAAIEPLCIDDWEILELNAEYIQSELLSQVRVVWSGLVLPIWVSGNICIFVKVGLTEPKGRAYIQLDQLTELIVSPKDRQRLPTWKQAESVPGETQVDPVTSATDRQGGDKSKHAHHSSDGSYTGSTNSQASSTDDERSNSLIYGMIKKWLPFLTPESSPTEPALPPTLSSNAELVDRQWSVGEITTTVGRVVFSRLHELDSWWASHPSVCVVNRSMVPKAKSAAFLAELTLLLSPMDVEVETKRAAKFRRRNQRNARPVKTERHVGVVCVVIKDSSTTAPFIPPGHILLDEMFCKLHRIKMTSKVQLDRMTCQPSAIERIQIQPTHPLPEFMNKESILVAFKNYLRVVCSTHHYPLCLISANTVNIQIAAGQSADFLVLVDEKKAKAPSSGSSEEDEDTPPVPPFFYLRDEDVPGVALVCEEVVTKRCDVSLLPEGMISPHVPSLNPVGCLELHQRLINFMNASLQARSEGAFLLCGSRGTGKTTLATSVLHHMARHKHCFTYKLESSQLRGKTFDTIRRLLDSVLEECAWRQPSILFIDDLHSLCKAPAGPEDEVSAEILYSAKVSEVLRDRLCTMWRKKDKIGVVATSLSRDSLHGKLTATHGVHLFHITEEMPSLDQTTRSAMLKSIMNNLEINAIPSDKQLLSLSDKLEGYVARDLVAVVKRASHAHTILSKGHPSASVTADDIEAALEGFTPASLRGVTLHSPGESTWKDVGGLHNIKDQLVRMLEWPVKYRKLYSQCPIRLQSGVLLYGAPGTGKTLVAAVVAKEMGLNFISIKGPELLNKYIGASEQGVRDTFTKAQDVRPCILFFDEFESLAPRRGHDSTGVTDRVVNQLLTQLDGVEALEGVYVLAATSRPDLIDPALLRPGRLDKSLCCGIPTPDDRREILEALARHMYIAADVDLKKVADKCDYCTGADLKSLLVNAQLEAVHDLMNKSSLHQDSINLSEATNDDGEPVTGIYMSTMDGEVQPITPKMHCYQQVKRLYSQNAGYIPKRRSTKSFVDSVVTIQRSHIASALSTLQPSVSETERLKYQRIYEQFTSSKTDRAMESPDQLTTAMQRVSLA